MKILVKDELGVPGHVVMHRSMTKKEAIAELRAIMDRWEKQGHAKPDDVPEGDEKERYRTLLRALKINVHF